MSMDLILFDELPDVLERFGQRFPDAVVRALQRAGAEGLVAVLDTVRNTQPYAPIDTGAYLRSWVVHKFDDGADIVNDASYAAVIEDGARPHPPSRAKIDALTDWVIRKVRGPFNKRYSASGFSSSFRRTMTPGDRRKVARRIAWAIAKKHEREGIPPKAPLGRAWPRIVDIADRAIAREIEADSSRRWGIR